MQGAPIPGSELICIFDADQVPSKDFFLRMVPMLDAGDDVAMVLGPQCCHNLNRHTDIFHHSILQFWCATSLACFSVCIACWLGCMPIQCADS